MEKVEQWIAGAIGRSMNPDNSYGLQCKDAIDDYAMAIFPGKSWVETVRPANAKDVFTNAPDAFWIKTRNNPNDANQLPKRGDVIVFNGWTGNIYGHIAVVENADAAGVTVIQQDGFTPTRPAHRKRWNWGQLPVIGWLTPRVATQQQGGRKLVDANDLNYIYKYGPLGRGRGAGEGEDVYVGKTAAFVINDHLSSNEYQVRAKAAADAQLATERTVNELRTTAAELTKQIEELKKNPNPEALKALEKQLEDTKKKADEFKAQADSTKTQLEELQKQKQEGVSWLQKLAFMLSQLFSKK